MKSEAVRLIACTIMAIAVSALGGAALHAMPEEAKLALAAVLVLAIMAAPFHLIKEVFDG